MFEINFNQIINPVDKLPYQVIFSVSFKNEMLKDRIINKYVEADIDGHSGFLFYFEFPRCVGDELFRDVPYIDLYDSIKGQAVVKFHSQKDADRFKKKSINYLSKFFKKEEKEFLRLLEQAKSFGDDKIIS